MFTFTTREKIIIGVFTAIIVILLIALYYYTTKRIKKVIDPDTITCEMILSPTLAPLTKKFTQMRNILESSFLKFKCSLIINAKKRNTNVHLTLETLEKSCTKEYVGTWDRNGISPNFKKFVATMLNYVGTDCQIMCIDKIHEDIEDISHDHVLILVFLGNAKIRNKVTLIPFMGYETRSGRNVSMNMVICDENWCILGMCCLGNKDEFDINNDNDAESVANIKIDPEND